jgi:pilus assembly protein CpaC
MSKQSWAVTSAIVGLVLTQALLHTIPPRVMAQDTAPSGDPGAVFESATFSVDGPTQRLEMVVATSRILTLEQKIPRLLVNNPDIVRATPISPNQVQLSALRPGVTQLNVWDETQRLYTVDVVVSPDARQLQMVIQSEFPDAAVRVRPLAGSVYLSGYVPSPGMVNSIVRIAEDYYPKVVNNMTVGGVQQILLKTKVMEVSRTKLRRVGFDWAFLDNQGFVFQSVSGLLAGATNPATAIATGNDTVRFGIVDGNSAFYGFIDALRQNDLIKILAEPQLTTISGRPASFNSGGEFPIIVPQSLGTVSIEYRQYGTRVDFVPIVLGNGNLRLEVRPQVSEIDTSRSVVINSVSVPALRTRWVDTAVEMKAGQTLALAGLLQQRVEAQNRGLPWLADLPWFGAPFRHIAEEVNEVELLIMVTPEFVEGVDPNEVPPCGPGEATTTPNDVELYWRGYMEVPRCCEDGSCPSCQPSEMHAAPTPADGVTPDSVLAPTPADTVRGGPTAAPRPSGTAAPAATPASRDASAADTRGAGKKPALIGPVGYDTLK